MANSILATTPLSYKDIDHLGQLFSRVFLHLNELDILSEQTQTKRLFFQKIRTIVGLAITAALVEQGSTELLEPHLNNFLQYPLHGGNTERAARAGFAMGDIISLGSDAFRALGHPEYYDYFLNTLRDSLQDITTEFKINKPAYLDSVMALITGEQS